MFKGLANSFKNLERRFIPPKKSCKTTKFMVIFTAHMSKTHQWRDIWFYCLVNKDPCSGSWKNPLSSRGELVTAVLHGISAFFAFTLHQQWPSKPPHKAPPGNGIPKHGQLFCRVPWDQPPNRYPPGWPQEQMKILRWILPNSQRYLWVMKICRFLSSWHNHFQCLPNLANHQKKWENSTNLNKTLSIKTRWKSSTFQLSSWWAPHQPVDFGDILDP